MKNIKIISVAFFPVYPVTFGSSVVVDSFFSNLKTKSKLLFQVTDQNSFLPAHIKSIATKKKNKLSKLICVIKLIFLVILEIKKTKKELYLVIEGASWIGYAYLLMQCTRFIIKKKIFIIYRGHSVEYEIRKNNSNYFISLISFFFEKYVHKKAFITTAVSEKEQKIIEKLYGIKPYIFPNIINIYKNKVIKYKKKYPYILYSGSYLYKPNQVAIDILVNKIFPKLVKKNPKLKLVLTGSENIPHKRSWLISKGIVTKKNYYKILKNCNLLLVASKDGYGTRVKIIEALCYGVVVVTTVKGIEGIEYQKKNRPPFVCKNNKELIDKSLLVLIDQKYEKIAQEQAKIYRDFFDSKKQISLFYKFIKQKIK